MARTAHGQMDALCDWELRKQAVMARAVFDSRVDSDQASYCGTGIGTGGRWAAGTQRGWALV